MLREELGLAFHQLRGIGFERFGDLRVQLPSGIAQQAVVRCVPHQRMLEGIDRVRRLSSLRHQLGRDQPTEGRL